MDAHKLRARGNEHYKQNEYLLAIRFYEKAIEKAASNDPLPHSNLSAALFETGDYVGCIDAGRTALSRGRDKDASLKEKLSTRIVNAELHIYARDNTLRPQSTTSTMSLEATAVYTCIEQAYRVHTKDQAWSKIIQEIPTIKPVLTGVHEHPVWGNHHAVSLYDSSLTKINALKPEQVALAKQHTNTTQPVSNQVSLGFACTGDGRQLYATWVAMFQDKALLSGNKRVQITTNDVRPQTVARNLVIFMLLEDLNKARNSEHKSLLFHTIYYIYCNQLMPLATETVMKQEFVQIIEMLEGRSSFPTWLKIAARYRQSIVLVLRSWQRQNHRYSSKRIQQEVTHSYFGDVQHGRLPALDELEGRAISMKPQIELSIYRITLALSPNLDFAKKYEPYLATALQQLTTLESAKGRVVKELREYVAQNWKVNPTWYADDFEDFCSHIAAIKPTIENIPNDFFMLSLISPPDDAACFYDYMHAFFASTGNALHGLAKSMTVTMTIGELIPKLERARYISNTSKWTTTHGFDRVNPMSLPDLSGLSLMSHIFMNPHIKKHDTACTVITSGLYLGLQNAQNVDTTSTALANPADLSNALGVEYEGFMPERLAPIVEILMKETALMWPNKWKPTQSSAGPTNQLLSKDATSTWLYGLFFKLALPSNRQPISPLMRVHSPLNLSTFYRLLVHLTELGYPGHSLSQVIVSILTDNVTTSARPATSQVLTGPEVIAWKTNVKRTFCVALFFAKMSTLAAIFTRDLPFAIITNAEIVPPLSNIRKCTVCFPHLPHDEDCNYIAIVFISSAFKPRPGTGPIRETILNQEYVTKHKDDIVIITTWKYDAPRRLGTFWMREDIARKIDPEYRMCEVYSTFTWKPLYPERAWRTYLQMQIGESWID